ncbi:hypothetical protein [Haloarchaeobius salinus]|uniref:hypothetical protein n=1 Tax=Haloarchaeobius salinus TaxID=1198298 RepID=UPI00210D8884|nr:hypothetical protein [Haloarchaeobius salinus]
MPTDGDTDLTALPHRTRTIHTSIVDGWDVLTEPFDGDRVTVNSQADIERAEWLLSE